MTTHSFLHKYQPPEKITEPVLWFLLSDDKIAICADPEFSGIPFRQAIFPIQQSYYMGIYQGRHCFAAEVNEVPAGFELKSLRQLYDVLGEDLLIVAGIAKQIITWQKQHQFCGQCGGKTIDVTHERAKFCPLCKLSFYPRISPVAIVLVYRGNELLLARSPHFPPGIYSTLAGFVELGETVEQTIMREIREEVAITVQNIRYFSSQPWPFPHSLMLGFTAEYAGGEIKIDGKEIEDAQWFTMDKLPKLPAKISIARRLIQDYLEKAGITS